MRQHIYNTVTENILRVGRHIFGIFDPEGKDNNFFYTIGNSTDQLPEILLIGKVPGPLAMDIINRVSEIQLKSGKRIPEGLLDIDYTMPLKVRNCTDAAKEKYTVQVGEYFQSQNYGVIQVMIPDKQGKFPGDEGCAEIWNVDQP